MEKLCDPSLSDIAEVTDLMICAPWAAPTFSCLTNGVDHTACCQARGLPDLCQKLCTGNITQLDFSYFRYAYNPSLFTFIVIQAVKENQVEMIFSSMSTFFGLSLFDIFNCV